MAEVPTKEKFIRVGKKLIVNFISGTLTTSLLRNGTKVAQLHKAARDWIGRPRLAGHMLAIPINAIAALVGKGTVSEQGAFALGYSLGDVIATEVLDAEPVIKVYPDKIRVEGFDANAEIVIVIDGKVYDANAFTTPATRGTIDTTNNKLLTDGDGIFEANFADTYELASGEHDVYVYQVGSKKAARLKAAL